MDETTLKEIISDALRIDVKQLEATQQDNWDSLDHLAILVRLEAKFPNQITSVVGIENCFSYEKIRAKLVEQKILL